MAVAGTAAVMASATGALNRNGQSDPPIVIQMKVTAGGAPRIEPKWRENLVMSRPELDDGSLDTIGHGRTQDGFGFGIRRRDFRFEVHWDFDG